MKALITGSFDPVTNGHLDVIKRAAAIFDEVVVGMFINPEKKYFFDTKTRLALLKESVASLKNVAVDFSEGYVADYVRQNGIDVIVKGVRNPADFEYEAKMAEFNKQLSGGIETFLLTASKETETLSSTLVKETFLSGDDISAYVPESVATAFVKQASGKK